MATIAKATNTSICYYLPALLVSRKHPSALIARTTHGLWQLLCHHHLSLCSRGEDYKNSRCDCLLSIVCLWMCLVVLINLPFVQVSSIEPVILWSISYILLSAEWLLRFNHFVLHDYFCLSCPKLLNWIRHRWKLENPLSTSTILVRWEFENAKETMLLSFGLS